MGKRREDASDSKALPATAGRQCEICTKLSSVLRQLLECARVLVSDGHLLVLENDAELPAPYAGMITWLKSVGLDRSVTRRGIAVLEPGRLSAQLFGLPGVRIFKAITPTR